MTIRTFKAALVGSVFAAAAFAGTTAQAATASATASANILTQVSVTKDFDLDFGTIAIGTSGGTVTVGNTDNRTCGSGLVCSASAKSAAFTIAGAPNQLVGISIDPSVTLNRVTPTAGGASMSATLSTSVPTATLSATGGATFTAGGILTVANTQAAGGYQGTFNVTVNYQ
jgi:Mat/Ecp fimbriae major subunit